MSFKKKEAPRDSSADEFTMTLNRDEMNSIKYALEERIQKNGSYISNLRDYVKLYLQFDEALTA